MPSIVTVFAWTKVHPEFLKMYAQARNFRAEVNADEILELADKPNIGVRVKQSTKNGREVIRGDNVERSKLQVDARKWNASKLLPRRYGEKPLDESDAEEKLSTEIGAIWKFGPIKKTND